MGRVVEEVARQLVSQSAARQATCVLYVSSEDGLMYLLSSVPSYLSS